MMWTLTEVCKISQAEPFIAITGKAGTEAAQYFIVSLTRKQVSS